MVTGVDPSATMLEVARKKNFGTRIEWIQASAQEFSSSRLFDLIVMTGHAFQVLLTEDDVLATFSKMRAHLKPDGKVVFESRNPNIDWSERWNYRMTIELPTGSVVESRKFQSMPGDVMKFDLIYEFPDETLVSNSELKFFSKTRIIQLLRESGLQTETLLGDWEGNDFDDHCSEEMIFVVGRE